MYFINSKIPNQIDLGLYSEVFDYRKLMYPDWLAVLEEQMLNDKQNANLICDLSAALLTNIYQSSYSHKDIFAQALRCCEQIIEDLGYSSSDEHSFYEELGSKQNGQHVCLVAGCQNDEMIRRRAEKAAELCIKSGKNFDVIFSGLNPGSDKLQRFAIQNESMEMKKHFTNYMTKHSAEMPLMNRLQFEPASNNTNENLTFFFERYVEKHYTIPINLHIVSSSFHLIRLSETLRKLLTNKNYQQKIASVRLIGSETIDHEFVFGATFTRRYLKLMLFDVFRAILVEHPKNIGNDVSRKN